MQIKSKHWLSIAAAILSLFNLLCFYSIRSMWSGIIAVLGQSSPYFLLGIIFVLSIVATVRVLYRKNTLWVTSVILVMSSFFFAAECYIMSVTWNNYRYFIREFMLAFTALLGAGLLVWLIFYYPKSRLANSTAFRWALVVAPLSIGIISVFHLVPNAITTIPVVYAVGEEYQIVFTTRNQGTAWVTIGDKEYNDTYAGSRMSETTVHKISVPMHALDAADGYTIHTRSMLLRGPYSAWQGRTISETYQWRGVNTVDGLKYYAISDTHTDINAPANAASYFGDQLDFLICTGDTANWVDKPTDIKYFLKLAGKVTGGAVPVVYARGNHETKGLLADELYRYVGAKGQDFYYTFRLQNIWGVVLDMGEDHGDDWSEFYGSSKFDTYRNDQTAFLDEILKNRETEFDAPGVDYRLAVCHIPVTFQYRNDAHAEYKAAWIERLNQMKLTMMFGGHRHQLMYIDPAFEAGCELIYHEAYAGYNGTKPDGYMTMAEFPAILVSRKSDIQGIHRTEKNGDKVFIGLAVSADDNTTTLQFTNQDHQVVENIQSPWFSGVHYGNSIVVDNK